MATNKSKFRRTQIIEIWELSPTVKGIKLLADWNKDVSFKAGQWIHVSIPSIDRLGGYTVCNSPLEFARTGIIQLAVKYSKHASSHWMNSESKVGDTVLVEFGGTTFYDPQLKEPQHDLLLIAAGIGMNSIFSILNLVTEREASGVDKTDLPEKVHLMYSSKTKEELLYKEKLEEMEKTYQNISCQFFVTQQKMDEPNVKNFRINSEALKDALKMVDESKCRVFLSLPVEMCNEIEDKLIDLKVDIKQIFSINWW